MNKEEAIEKIKDIKNTLELYVHQMGNLLDEYDALNLECVSLGRKLSEKSMAGIIETTEKMLAWINGDIRNEEIDAGKINFEKAKKIAEKLKSAREKMGEIQAKIGALANKISKAKTSVPHIIDEFCSKK